MKFFKLAILAFFVALYCSSADAELTNLSPLNHQISTDFYYFEEAGVVNYYKDAEDYIYDFYQGSLDVLSELAQAVKEISVYVYKTTENFALNLQSTVVEALEEGKELLFEVAQNTKEACSNGFEVVKTYSYEALDSAKESTVELYQSVEETVEQGAVNFVLYVKSGYNILQEKFAYFAWSHEDASFHMYDEFENENFFDSLVNLCLYIGFYIGVICFLFVLGGLIRLIF